MIDSLHAQVISAFLGESQHVETLSENDPVKGQALLMGDTFTRGVDYLRSVFPRPGIRQLMGLVWDIVGHKIVPVALGPDVPSVSLALFGNPVIPQTAVFLPKNWLEEVRRDPVLQMGALVFVGSQVVDVYNHRLVDEGPNSIKRARAYEAEFLLHARGVAPNLSFNEYQQRVMAEYPRGLQSEAVQGLLYTSRSFSAPS